MNITLRQLSYVIALAETRHFGRAADQCHVTQPALSNQIKELEVRLGTPLFVRERKGVELTSSGQDVLATAKRIMAELERMEDAVHWQRGLTGRLRLGVIPTVAPYLLPVALPLIRGQTTGLDLRLREAQTADLISDLEDGRLDAAIIALPSGVSGMVETPLFRDRFLLAGTAEHIVDITQNHPVLRPDVIDPDQLLLLDEGHCLADQALEACGFPRGGRRVDLGAASLGTLCRLAAGGLGVTFLPEMARHDEQKATPDLSVARFADPQPSRQIGLVRRNLSPHIEWFNTLAGLLKTAGRAVASPSGHASGS
ncbi:LysR substrate-binding domain-containing protein [Aliiroseovarius sp. S1339]|uniref:hydrogen peroxide-inducible genes activator n=1 Tax=Aliiroseovarius sp. S1339 TaxID=2936990 RepID=UPI0020BE4434|nr:hydrogen peroxide-inducible genes activator [Aliiroseovarius sp. S1339]MCK8463569.1 LysR substrate-binding domain-containing protein [Aliiroseovarius sp. S1339]